VHIINIRGLFLYFTLCRFIILLFWFVTSTALACSEHETCIKKSSWHLGIAFGVGIKTNPLVDGDNIPLVILPDIAWYAEQAYFDNGELGYQWINQSNFAFETFLQLDQERAFFSFLHPANILVSSNSFAADTSPENIQTPQPSLSIDEIASRKWAINGGIRGHYFLTNGEWQLTFQQDISNVHKGQLLGLEYSHSWLWHSFRLGMRIGTDWKSSRLLDYYYGVSKRDTDFPGLYYNGQSGWQTYVSLNAQKPINENWSWLANIGYRRLPSSLTSSPLVERNNISNIFLGVAYRF
jgi:outer membrane protein